MADWDVNSPSDSDFIAQFPANERAARAALVANFGVDHEANAADANIGKHVKVSLVDQSSDPAGATNSSTLYAKGVSGASQLFWRSGTGAVVQLTAAGGLRAESLVGTISDDRLPSNVPLKDEAVAFESTLSVAGGATFSSTVAITGNATIGGNLTLTGTLNGVNVGDFPRKNVQNTFTDSQVISASYASLYFQDTGAAPDNRWWAFNVSSELLRGLVHDDVFNGSSWLTVSRTGITVDAIELSATDISLSGAVLASTIATSTSTTLTAGRVHAVTGNATLPNMTAGQWVGVINNGGSPITVTKNASDTMYWTASGASVTSITVAARGKVTFFCADGANVYASGNIIGAS